MKVELVNEITEYGGVWQSFEKIDVEIEKMRSNGSGSSKILAALIVSISVLISCIGFKSKDFGFSVPLSTEFKVKICLRF
jgi:hypothetical protein